MEPTAAHDGGGSHGGLHDSELSMLESSPAVIATIMSFFLVVTLGLECGLHRLRRWLRGRRRVGLLAAVDALASELMLLGVASLALTAIEPRLERLCLPVSGERAVRLTPWLQRVDGCACCLARTEGVSACFLAHAQCPADYEQRCAVAAEESGGGDGGADRLHRIVVRTEAAIGALLRGGNLSEAVHEPVAARALLAAAPSTSPAPAPAPAHSSAAPHVCAGPARAVWPECRNRPGYAPVLTSETVEQVHMFLFTVTVAHVLVGALAILLSTLKLRLWHRLAGPDRDGDDDDGAAAAAAAASAPLAIASGSRKLAAAPSGGGGVGGNVELAALGAGGGAAAAGGSASAAARADATGDVEAGADAARHRGGSSSVSTAAPPAGAAAAASDADGSKARGAATATADGGLLPALAAKAAGICCAAWGGARAAAAVVWRQLSPLTVTGDEYAALRASFFLTHGAGGGARRRGGDEEGLHAPAARHASISGGAAAPAHGNEAAPAVVTASGSGAVRPERAASLSRRHTGGSAGRQPSHAHPPAPLPHGHHGDESDDDDERDTDDDHDGAHGAAHAQHPPHHPHQPPQQQYTYTYPKPELYARYLLEAAERDGARVVGLGLATWLPIIAFVLLSGAIGWAAWLFSLFAAVVLVGLNTFLICTLRAALKEANGDSGSGGGGDSTKRVRPQPRVLVAPRSWARCRRLLPPLVKLALFCLSFVVSNSAFFAVFYGPESCFFSRTGFQSNPVSWWAVLLADIGMLASAGLVTMPTYALLAHSFELDAGVLRGERAGMREDERRRSSMAGGASSAGGGRSGGGGWRPSSLRGFLMRQQQQQ